MIGKDGDANGVAVVPSASVGKRKRTSAVARDVVVVSDGIAVGDDADNDDDNNNDGDDNDDGGGDDDDDSNDNNDDDDATNEEGNDADEQKNAIDERQQAPVRRQVGRPRKYPLAPPTSTAAIAEPAPHNRRGRPRKQPRAHGTRASESKRVALVKTFAAARRQKDSNASVLTAATSSGSAHSSTTATVSSSAPAEPARASGAASSKSSAANQAVQRPPAVQPVVAAVAVADAVDHFVNLDDAAAWYQFRPLLATFIGDIVANRDGKYEVARFNNMPAARAEYASALARISGGGNGGVGVGGFQQFATFVYETAVTTNQAAYVSFAARFAAPLHKSAHVDFLCPLVYRRLCAVARVHGLGLGGAVERFVLPCNLLTEIEAHQRRVAEAAAAEQEEEK